VQAAVGTYVTDGRIEVKYLPETPLGAAAATLASGGAIYTHFLFQVHDYRVKERVVFFG